MEDEEETEITETPRDPQKWAWISLWSLFIACSAAHLTLWATFWAGVSDMMDEHRNWREGREKFAEKAAMEIEALIKDQEGQVNGLVP